MDDFTEWTLPPAHLGQRVRIYERLDSTNTLGLSFASDPTQHGLVLIARQQTAGRGQYGRTWQAPPGSSVLMSVLLFPPPALRRPVLLTAWAAVSVCETIRSLIHRDATIKWPNDVLIDGRKVCGILIEQRTTGHADFPLATVAGIGLNVTQTRAMFERAELPDACSLAMLSDERWSAEDVAKALIRQLDRLYATLVEGDLGALESLWKSRLGLVGKSVIAEGIQRSYRGRLVDLTFDGLVLETGGGDLMQLAPQVVRHLYPDLGEPSSVRRRVENHARDA